MLRCTLGGDAQACMSGLAASGVLLRFAAGLGVWGIRETILGGARCADGLEGGTGDELVTRRGGDRCAHGLGTGEGDALFTRGVDLYRTSGVLGLLGLQTLYALGGDG